MILLVICRIIELFGCAYVYTKYGFEQITTIKQIQQTPRNNILTTVLTLILTLITFTICLLTYLALGLFKILLAFYLQHEHGSNYGEVLRFGDNNFYENTQNIIQLVLLIKFDGSKEKFLDYAKELCRKMLGEEKRLTSTRMQFLGYQYLLYNQINFEDIFSSTKFGRDDLCNYQTICEFVEGNFHRVFPKNGSFQMIAGEQQVVLDDDTSSEIVYPILFRFHHSISDGLTILNFFESMSEGILTPVTSVNTKNINQSNLMMKNMFNWKAQNAPIIKAKDDNILKVSKLSQKTHVAFRLDTSKQYIDKVKTIKNSVPNGSFSSVLLAALSASLCNHFNKYNKEMPNDVVVLVPTVRDKESLTHKSLKNIYTPALITVPLKISQSDKNSDKYDRLRECIREYNKSLQSLDISIFYWISTVFADIAPLPIIKTMTFDYYDISTVMVSSIPSSKPLKILGHEIKNSIPVVPLCYTIGVGVGLITYKDQFQISICADAKVIPERSQVEELLDFMLTYIDDLYEETLERRKRS